MNTTTSLTMRDKVDKRSMNSTYYSGTKDLVISTVFDGYRMMTEGERNVQRSLVIHNTPSLNEF
jgi:hypothetical protein